MNSLWELLIPVVALVVLVGLYLLFRRPAAGPDPVDSVLDDEPGVATQGTPYQSAVERHARLGQSGYPGLDVVHYAVPRDKPRTYDGADTDVDDEGSPNLYTPPSLWQEPDPIPDYPADSVTLIPPAADPPTVPSPSPPGYPAGGYDRAPDPTPVYTAPEPTYTPAPDPTPSPGYDSGSSYSAPADTSSY